MNICGMGDILKMSWEILSTGIVGYKCRLIWYFNGSFVMGKVLFSDLKREICLFENLTFNHICNVKLLLKRENKTLKRQLAACVLCSESIDQARFISKLINIMENDKMILLSSISIF